MTILTFLISERGEVVPHRTDDAFLLRFLRARRFDVEKAHRLVSTLSLYFCTLTLLLTRSLIYVWHNLCERGHCLPSYNRESVVISLTTMTAINFTVNFNDSARKLDKTGLVLPYSDVQVGIE